MRNSIVLSLTILGSGAVMSQDNAELAKKLSNPVASLISVPIQMNYDERFGSPEGGRKLYVNVQPVIPVSINNDWNMISRTIVPLINQDNVIPGTSQSGLGDITQSLFFSPKQPTAGGLIWGVGPVFLLPTGSDDLLSARKWGLGPTAVLLKQQGPWTYGALGNHIWSVGGDSDRADISTTFLQPFVAYTTPTAWTFNANLESTYDWKNEQWSVPINATVSKMLRVKGQAMSVGGGVRYWAEGPQNGPHGWGYRVFLTFLFPK